MEVQINDLDTLEVMPVGVQPRRPNFKRIREIVACDLLLARLFAHHRNHAGIESRVIDLEPPEAPPSAPSPWPPVQEPEDEIPGRQVRIARILECVADYYAMDTAIILSGDRQARVSRARMVCCYLARDYTHQSWNRIAKRLGNIDHTSVINGYRRIGELIQTDDGVSLQVSTIRQRIAQSL